MPKKAVTDVRHLEYREVLEEGSERRAAFAQLRSRAHIAVETVEKKSLSPFNDKVYGLDAHNSRPLGTLAQPGAAADAGRLRSARLRAPCDGVPHGPPPLGPAPTLPLRLSSDDGSEFKREFKELMDFWDIKKQVTRGHAHFAERIIRTIKKPEAVAPYAG